MVCSGAASEERERDSMDLGGERSKPLHNFTLPCLRWGGHKYLRCCRRPDLSAAVDRRYPARPEIGDGGIGAVRERLILDLKTAAERMRNAILREEEARPPWNLRDRSKAASPPWSSGGAPEKEERARFSVCLSREEIEEDYAAMAGGRPRRRPRKRPRNVQKQLDSVFPGLWLTEVSEEMYKVPELPDSGKR